MRSGGRFELFLFALRLDLISDAVAAGIDAVVVDWERRGKESRQNGFDTLVGSHTVDDLRAVRARTDGRVVCRINGPGPWNAEEIALAAEAGADEVLVPMIRDPREVEQLLEHATGSIRLGILIETPEAVERAEELGALPVARIYLGLNDLAIARGSDSIFEPFVDGVAEHVRHAARCPFGAAGMTLPGRGSPIPSELIAAELARLDCDFTFLRRSFHRDVEGLELESAVSSLRGLVEDARDRSPADTAADARALRGAIEAVAPWQEARVASA